LSGQHITQLQEHLYMKSRQAGFTQELSAAKDLRGEIGDP